MPQVSLTRTRPAFTAPVPRPGAVESIFSIDVEDWFHILQVPGIPQIHEWDQLPSCVERDFRHLMEMLAERNVRCTCFFLGWVARRYPHLVHEAASNGHEIASHGFAHRLVFQMTARRFREDSREARLLLEDLSGGPVRGYRAAGFSVIDRVPWFFETLLEAGYEYDSSVFPAPRQHGGITTAQRAPHRLLTKSGSLIEFPISVAETYKRAMCFFGGGYLRLFPLWLIRQMARKIRLEARPVIYYIHPREINPDHPRLRMPIHRRFKSYVNLHTTEPKVAGILAEFPMITFQEYIERYGDSLEQCHV